MKPWAFLFIAVFILSILFWGPSCANIIPPSGGPRDSIAPVLVKAVPGDSTVNFTGDRIEFTFDEFVDLQDVPNNVLFTPTFEKNPEIAVKGRTITVRFRDALEPNTTYSLNFGNAVRDINEMNILKGFRYTFSTGPVLDSMELSGKVLLAQTGKVDSTLVVMLHRDLRDSAVKNRRPPYVARVDGQGNFRFQNLPADSFAVYALGDAGIMRTYQRPSQLFAFLDSPVVTGQGGKDLVLYAWRDAAAPGVNPATVGARGGGLQGRDRLTFQANLSANQQDLLKDLTLSFPLPLRNLDTTKMRLTVDSTFNPVAYNIRLDSSRKLLTINTTWLENRGYNLELQRDFAEDSLGKKLLKSDTLFFRTRKASDYGALNLRFKNIDAASNPVLLFVQNDQVVYSAPMGSGSLNISRFVPGEYELRVLFDRNNNGVWDKGQFFGEKRQPEIVRPLEKRITVRPGSDNESEIAL